MNWLACNILAMGWVAIGIGISPTGFTPQSAFGHSASVPIGPAPQPMPNPQPVNLAQSDSHTEPPSSHDLGLDEWLKKERIVMLSGEIGPELAQAIIAQLLYLDAQAPGKDIYIYINSPGGEIASGMAIYDTMQALRSPIVTVTLGEASSMASVLLAGGTKGKRFALPNARIMIHQPLSGVQGQASDIAIEAKEVLYLKGSLNQLLANLSGQPLKRVELDTDRDFYMSAQEAKAYGLVDQVLNHLPSALRPLPTAP